MAEYENIVSIDGSRDEAYIDVIFDITADDDLTLAADLQGYKITGVIMPATWTAADITFEGSIDDSTFNPIKSKSGVAYTLTVSASDFIHLPLSDTYNFPRYIKVGSSNPQGADRTVKLVLRQS